MSPLNREKLRLAAIFGFAYFGLYVCPNFWPIFPPKLLPLTPFEQKLPFMPWSFTIYLSAYFLIFMVFFATKTKEELRAFVNSCLLVLAIGSFFFYFMPTYYLRPTYPAHDNWFVALCLKIIHESDKPTNCFPSMHVGFCTLAAQFSRIFGTRWFIFYSIWTGAVCLTVLTTKQHYFVDILGGFAASRLALLAEPSLSRISIPVLKRGDLRTSRRVIRRS